MTAKYSKDHEWVIVENGIATIGMGEAPARDRRDDTGDDVARFLHHDVVALANVLARDVVGVVERGHRHGGRRCG